MHLAILLATGLFTQSSFYVEGCSSSLSLQMRTMMPRVLSGLESKKIENAFLLIDETVIMGTYKKTLQLPECSWHVNVLQRFIHASCNNLFHRYIQSTFINISFMNIYYVIILYFYYRTWIWCLFYSFFFNFTYQPHFLLPPLLPLPHLPNLSTPQGA